MVGSVARNWIRLTLDYLLYRYSVSYPFIRFVWNSDFVLGTGKPKTEEILSLPTRSMKSRNRSENIRRISAVFKCFNRVLYQRQMCARKQN